MRLHTCAAALALIAIPLSGCTERLANVGQTPELTDVKHEDLPDIPKQLRPYQPSDEMAQATAAATRRTGGRSSHETDAIDQASLWRPDADRLFQDARARRVGDILTIVININDQAEFQNESTRSRESNEDLGVDTLLGYEGAISQVLPEAADAENAVGMSSTSGSSGEGATEREEEVNFRIAAMVINKLPNGNFVIRGKQEIRVNYELRDLLVTGIVRPEDIGQNNTVSYDKIAEARISYGGRGQITDVQQPRYGQQVLDALLPF